MWGRDQRRVTVICKRRKRLKERGDTFLNGNKVGVEKRSSASLTYETVGRAKVVFSTKIEEYSFFRKFPQESQAIAYPDKGDRQPGFAQRR